MWPIKGIIDASHEWLTKSNIVANSQPTISASLAVLITN
jgi:hypothetical protein